MCTVYAGLQPCLYGTSHITLKRPACIQHYFKALHTSTSLIFKTNFFMQLPSAAKSQRPLFEHSNRWANISAMFTRHRHSVSGCQALCLLLFLSEFEDMRSSGSVHDLTSGPVYSIWSMLGKHCEHMEVWSGHRRASKHMLSSVDRAPLLPRHATGPNIYHPLVKILFLKTKYWKRVTRSANAEDLISQPSGGDSSVSEGERQIAAARRSIKKNKAASCIPIVIVVRKWSQCRHTEQYILHCVYCSLNIEGIEMAVEQW